VPDDLRVEQLLDELCDSNATPEEVCSSCPELLPQVRERLRRMRRVEAEVDALFPNPSELGEGGPQSARDATTLPRVPGYEVEVMLGRGGMGVVFRARHLRLNRAVALKMLLAGPYARPEELERFLREAEAVAGLRHANIVQIYDIGDLNGRPYFTMEYIEGGSLAQNLARAPQTADRAAALVSTLAEAIQVAHLSGIIHRDLTPANILLTTNGTPKISDFGLARRIEGGVGLTVTGVPMGTPSYMAPEQVRGQLDSIGPATDVYGLGAVLYELLTGRAPFRAETSALTLQKALAEDPAPPSRLNTRVPRDLETICLKCLQKEPSRRYASAAALAEELRLFGRGEPITARSVGRLECLVRRAQRHPTAAGLLIAVVLLSAAVSFGVWSYTRQQFAARARQSQTDRKVGAELDIARGLLEQGWQTQDLGKLTEAEVEGNRIAEFAHSNTAGVELQHAAEAFRGTALEKLKRASNNRDLLEAVMNVSAPRETSTYARDETGLMLTLPQPSIDEQYATAFRRWGLEVDNLTEAEVAERLSSEPAIVQQELIAGLDAWMIERRSRGCPEAQWKHLFRIAERLDSSERQRRLRSLLVGEALPRPEWIAALVSLGSPLLSPWELTRGIQWRGFMEVRRQIDPRIEPVLTVLLLARALAALGDDPGAEEVMRQASTARPDQVLLLDALGKLLARQGPSRLEEAIGYYRAARGLNRRVGITLSKSLILAGRPAQAEEVLRDLLLQQSENPTYLYFLAIAVYEQNRHVDALPIFQKALDLKPNYPEVHYCLGIAFADKREDAQAEAAYRKAIEFKPDFAEAYVNLGIILSRQRRYEDAQKACDLALRHKPYLFQAHLGLASALLSQQKNLDAEEFCRKAVKLKPYIAEAHASLGAVLNEQHRYVEAESACRRALDLNPRLAEANCHLGTSLLGQRKPGESVTALCKAIELKPDYAEACYALGNAQILQGKHKEAIKAYLSAIELKHYFPEAYNNLGQVLGQLKRYEEAEAALRKALELMPNFGFAYHNLGLVLIQQMRFDEAAMSLRKAADLFGAEDPRHEQAIRLQQRCQRLKILDAELPEFLEGTKIPKNSAEQLAIAQLCLGRQTYVAAARFYRDAFAADSKLAEIATTGTRYHAACAAALAGSGKGNDADNSNDRERAFWRRQALEWLRQDLRWWNNALDNGSIQNREQTMWWMGYWQIDEDLDGLRVQGALEHLSQGERDECLSLWNDVAVLLRRAQRNE